MRENDCGSDRMRLGVTDEQGGSEALRIVLMSLVPPQHERARGDYIVLPARNRSDVVAW